MIFKSRMFWSLTTSYALVVLLTAVIVGGLVDHRLERDLREDLTATLQDECVLLESVARPALRRGSPTEELQAFLIDAGVRTGKRITLILPNGVVIGDSHEAPAIMGDHGARPEVVDAGEGGFGVSQRFSRTVGYSMLYVAHGVKDGGRGVGVVRVALPLLDVEEELGFVRRAVVLGSIAGFLGALALGLFLARRFIAPILAMTSVAEDLRAGNYGSRATVERRDEIGVLGDTLNRLGGELTERIANLSREDARLRAILAGMVEGVVAIDDQDSIAFCNGAARDFLSLGTGELVGRKLWERAAVGELIELVEEARTTTVAAHREMELTRRGRDRTLVAHASPFTGGGRSGLVIVLHDITELRHLERIRRDFVANVSHELKTPLTSIKGFVETLLQGALHDEENNERFLRRIEANVDRLNHLVSDLLSLARIEARGDIVATEPVDWAEPVRSVLRRHGELLAANGIACEVSAPKEGVRVRGDLEAMTQIVDNLIDNAVKYTPGPGHIHVRLRAEGEIGVLEVEDSGIGIPAVDVDRIFERFYRVDKARSHDLGGTGLGLSIVKNLALKMGGEVRVESEEGAGARFIVRLPLA